MVPFENSQSNEAAVGKSLRTLGYLITLGQRTMKLMPISRKAYPNLNCLEPLGMTLAVAQVVQPGKAFCTCVVGFAKNCEL